MAEAGARRSTARSIKCTVACTFTLAAILQLRATHDALHGIAATDGSFTSARSARVAFDLIHPVDLL
jgi:hypothetical protein